ncbi:MAG: hypothetical protein J5606_04995, partial [Bacteroidales bacterium]|nr:hypothetical protein [Bacteroidales bacterium]
EDLVKQDNTEKTRKSLNDDVIILDTATARIVEELTYETNVDIIALSRKPYITDMVEELSQEFSCIGELTEDDGQYLSDLAQMIEAFAQIEQMDSCLYYYELFCSYYNHKMDPCGMAFDLEPVVYEEVTYDVAIESINARKQKANNVISGICSDYSSFETLTAEQQYAVLEMAYFLAFGPQFLPQASPYDECVREANNNFTITVSRASVALTAGMASCAYFVNPYVIGGCLVAVTATYACDVASAVRTRNIEIENCNYQYGNN